MYTTSAGLAASCWREAGVALSPPAIQSLRLPGISPPAGHLPGASSPPPTKGGGEEHPGLKNKFATSHLRHLPLTFCPCTGFCTMPVSSQGVSPPLTWVKSLSPAPGLAAGFCPSNAASGPVTSYPLFTDFMLQRGGHLDRMRAIDGVGAPRG